MSTFTQTLYQIVFSTKHREKTLLKMQRPQFYSYIWDILKNKKCHLYRIGGIEDHIHIVTSLHPTVALSNLVKDIKVGSHDFNKRENLFPSFIGWQDGYAAFTYDISAKDNLIEYVKNQEEHHASISFKEELIILLKEHNIEFEEKYLD